MDILLAVVLLACPYASAAQPLKGRPAPTPGEVHSSGDGRFRWVEGEAYLQAKEPASAPRRVPLPPLPKGASRRVLFADSGGYFCVIDSFDQEVGLHLGIARGAKTAKALVLRSVVRLVDEGGRVLWSKDTPDAHAVGSARDARALRIANDGTMAILLHDVDPYTKDKPLLWVLRPSGREALRLDYQSWSKVDEFALSPDGAELAVRGFGHIPDKESWGRALGIYTLGTDRAWLASDPFPAARLPIVDSSDWARLRRRLGVRP